MSKTKEQLDQKDVLLGGKTGELSVQGSNAVSSGASYKAALGTEQIRAGQDTILPRLRLLQSLSSEVESGNLKAGMYFNTLTEKAFPTIEIIPLSLMLSRVLFNKDDMKGAPLARTMDMDFCNHPDHHDGPVPVAVCDHTKWVGGKPPVYSLVYNYPFITPEDVNKNGLPTVLSIGKASTPAALKMNTLVSSRIPPTPFWNDVWALSAYQKKFSKGTTYLIQLKHVRETTAEERAWAALVYQNSILGKKIDIEYDNESEAHAE